MMSIKEYAVDVNLTVEQVKALCDSLGINYLNEDSVLSDEDIVILDNNLDMADEITEEEIIEDEVADKDIKEAKKVIKKKNKSDKKIKENFKKEKKKLYKNKEKLTSSITGSNTLIYKKNMTVMDVAKEIKINPAELIKKLISMDVMANLNAVLEYDTLELLLSDYNITLTTEESTDLTKFDEVEIQDKEEDLVPRAPVITIMGHVDHGKTSLLDAIRKTNVAEKEAGGITQEIASYQIKYKDKYITFIDTPGHAAFTEMRARGAAVTDIVIIIVAADDGVKPQTVEAIDHAKAAGVPIIVAINKIDKEGANIESTKKDIAEAGLMLEEWGGDVLVNAISAKTGEGIDSLLDNILLISEMNEYKANPKRYAIGTVIEATKTASKGVIVEALIQNGTLRIGDPLVCGVNFGKVKSMKNDKGEVIAEAIPSMPVSIIGFTNVPEAGDKFMAFETEKEAKKVASVRAEKAKEVNTGLSGLSVEDLFKVMDNGEKSINVILKADGKGSVEAIASSLKELNVEGFKVSFVRKGVGVISASDIVLAEASKAIILSFNLKLNKNITDYAKEKGVTIKSYDVIYNLIEDMEKLLEGKLEPVYEEVVTGSLKVIKTFKFSKIGTIAGGMVNNGLIKNKSLCRLYRNNEEIYKGKISSLQRGTESIKEAGKGIECGLVLENFNDILEDDVIETYEEREVK